MMTPMLGLMAAVDEAREGFRRAEAAGRREEADRLVAPRAGEGMLGDRQALDVREAHVLHVGDQLVGELVIGEEAVAVLAPPRAEMHLVDRDRRGERLALAGARAIQSPSPHSWRGRPDDARGGRRRLLLREADRIGLQRQQPRRSRRAARTCRRAPRPTPGMKISQMPASMRLRIGWRRPSQWLKSPTTLTRRAFGAQTAKATPSTPSIVVGMRAEPLEDAAVAALGHQIDVERAEHRREAVGVFRLPGRVARCEAQPVGERRSAVRDRAGEEARRVRASPARPTGSPVARSMTVTLSAPGQKTRTESGAIAAAMHAEHGERIAVARLDDRRDRGRVGMPGGPRRRRWFHARQLPLNEHWRSRFPPRRTGFRTAVGIAQTSRQEPRASWPLADR